LAYLPSHTPFQVIVAKVLLGAGERQQAIGIAVLRLPRKKRKIFGKSIAARVEKKVEPMTPHMCGF